MTAKQLINFDKLMKVLEEYYFAYDLKRKPGLAKIGQRQPLHS